MERSLTLRHLIPLNGRTGLRLAGTAAVMLAALGGGAGLAHAGQAGAVPEVSQPVVQPLPSREALQLNAALSKLGRDPRNVDALVDAGDAASALGDYQAAIGFFRRAEQISRKNPRVMAGLASATVRAGDPFKAIPLFAEAEAAGADPAQIAGNRGLAYDLAGDPVTAQRYYQMALARGNDDEVSRRLAISKAISGDAKGMDQALLPLLRRQDKAAWRARAFSLAILGKTQESIKIIKTLLPAKLADGVMPYMEYMPRLTPAQQAAAANLGKFPRASEIGRDDPRVARVAPSRSVAVVDKAPFQAGEQRGSEAPVSASERRKREKEEARRAKKAEKEARRKARRVVPPEPKPDRQPGSVSEPVLAVASPPAAKAGPEPVASPSQSASQSMAGPAPKIAVSSPDWRQGGGASQAAAPPPTAPASRSPGPGFDLASLPNSSSGEPVAGEAAPSDANRSFGDMFQDIGRPQAQETPEAGAVDIRKIEPAKPKKEAPKPPPPSHPSRIWVQLGIGQNISALSFDWRRLQKKSPELLKDRKAFVSKLNQTNRMLTGPFESVTAANRFISALRKAGIEGPYLWTSPAGQVVDAM